MYSYEEDNSSRSAQFGEEREVGIDRAGERDKPFADPLHTEDSPVGADVHRGCDRGTPLYKLDSEGHRRWRPDEELPAATSLPQFDSLKSAVRLQALGAEGVRTWSEERIGTSNVLVCRNSDAALAAWERGDVRAGVNLFGPSKTSEPPGMTWRRGRMYIRVQSRRYCTPNFGTMTCRNEMKGTTYFYTLSKFPKHAKKYIRRDKHDWKFETSEKHHAVVETDSYLYEPPSHFSGTASQKVNIIMIVITSVHQCKPLVQCTWLLKINSRNGTVWSLHSLFMLSPEHLTAHNRRSRSPNLYKSLCHTYFRIAGIIEVVDEILPLLVQHDPNIQSLALQRDAILFPVAKEIPKEMAVHMSTKFDLSEYTNTHTKHNYKSLQQSANYSIFTPSPRPDNSFHWQAVLLPCGTSHLPTSGVTHTKTKIKSKKKA